MPYHRFKTPIYLEDVDGNARALKGCALNNLPTLYNLLELILQRLGESKCDTIGDLWIEDLFWRSLVEEALRLVGLKAAWFTPANLAELILPSKDENGNVVQGLIASVCFPQAVDSQNLETSDRLSLEQYKLHQLVNLVQTGMAPSLKEALEIGDLFNEEEIATVMDHLQEVNKKIEAKRTGRRLPTAKEKKLLEELTADPSKLFSMPSDPTLVKGLST